MLSPNTLYWRNKMAKNKIICECKNIDYITIRKAMVAGSRTLDEIQKMIGASTVCRGCANEIEKILASVCGCHNVSLEEVTNAIKNGANTVEKVGEVTKAGTDCKRCKVLIQNIIDLGR